MNVEDEQDFERFFDSAFHDAQRASRRLVGNPAVAEDIAAEAMARACTRWDRVGALAWREAWVMRVTVNLSLDWLRRGAPPRPTLDEGDDWEDAVVLRAVLAQALARLPRRQREVVALRCLADLTEADAARALGVAPRTVSQHLGRALNRLRSLTGDDDTEELTRALET